MEKEGIGFQHLSVLTLSVRTGCVYSTYVWRRRYVCILSVQHDHYSLETSVLRWRSGQTKGRQMCWCFTVFLPVIGNLARRICSDVLDSSYKMCTFCCCTKSVQVTIEQILGKCLWKSHGIIDFAFIKCKNLQE